MASYFCSDRHFPKDRNSKVREDGGEIPFDCKMDKIRKVRIAFKDPFYDKKPG